MTHGCSEVAVDRDRSTFSVSDSPLFTGVIPKKSDEPSCVRRQQQPAPALSGTYRREAVSTIQLSYQNTFRPVPAATPSDSAGTITKPSACVVDESIDAPLIATGTIPRSPRRTRQ